jgi:hypothetical protein
MCLQKELADKRSNSEEIVFARQLANKLLADCVVIVVPSVCRHDVHSLFRTG